jgi:hypothetical protein
MSLLLLQLLLLLTMMTTSRETKVLFAVSTTQQSMTRSVSLIVGVRVDNYTDLT